MARTKRKPVRYTPADKISRSSFNEVLNEAKDRCPDIDEPLCEVIDSVDYQYKGRLHSVPHKPRFDDLPS